MAGKSYSAGRIFLQVVPSFRGLQRDIAQEVRKANRGVDKEHEEAGKRAAEARALGERKVEDRERRRRKSVQGGSDAERALKEFQRFSQMMVDARVKQSARDEARDIRNAKRRWKLASDLAKGDIKAEQERQKSLEAYQRAFHERLDKAEADAAKRRQDSATRSMRNLMDLDRKVADGQRKIDEKAARERDAREARDESRRAAIRKRRAASRLAGMRAEDSERRRLAGGDLGQRIRKGAKGAADAIGIIKIDADSSEARREIAALRVRLLELSDTDVGVDLNAKDAMAELEAISARLTLLARKSPDIDIDVNAKGALFQIARVKHEINELDRKRVASNVGGWFAGMKSSAEDGANSFRIFNPMVIGLLAILPILPPLLASTAAGIGAIGTAAIGGGIGLGVMIAGFTGIGDALTALNDVQNNAEKDTLASSKAIRTSLKSLRDAEQGVADQRTRAARAAEDASRRVAQARRNVSDVEKRVARDIQGALRAQENAERRLERAQKDAADAQRDLLQARIDAEKQQQDLADRIASGKLDERQALIDLFEAQVAYNAAMADGGATNLEREQASIQLERARLAIKGIRQENAELTKEQKTGGQAAKTVADAQERAADAAQAVTDAQRDAADAEQGVRDARVDGARDIADANQAVADAIQNQADVAADNARAQRDATERLSDAQAAYQEALTKTGDIGSSSMQKLEQAMGKLSPAGRDFARFLFGLQPFLLDLRGIIQEGMLPGVQEAISGLVDRYGPALKDFLGVMSKTVGTFFKVFGEAMQSPVMVTFFETMAKYAPVFFTQFGDLFINLLKIIGGLATAFAPFAQEFMDGLLDMTAGWAEWAAGLKDDDGFKQFLDYVRREGPKLLDLIGDIFTIIIKIGKGMSESGAFDSIVGFFDFIAGLDPKLLSTIFGSIVALVIASQVSAGINALAISFLLLTRTAVGLATLGFGALIIGFVLLYQNNEAFRAFVQMVWAKIQEYVAAFVNWIKESFLPWWQNTAMPIITAVFKEIARVAKWLWDNILFPVFSMIGDIAYRTFNIIKAAWTNILWPLLGFIGAVFMELWNTVISPVFSWIGEAFSNAIGVIKWVWDNVLSHVFDAITSALEGDFVGAFDSALKAVEGIWNGLKRIAAVPVNFVIQTVLNEGLFAAINKVFEFLGMETRIPDLPRVTWGEDAPAVGNLAFRGSRMSKNQKYQFDTGGYTGRGGKYEPAGIVHRDEYVLRKEATNVLLKTIGIQGLDFINQTGQLPFGGFAIGGMVKPVNAAPGASWGRYPSGKRHRAIDFPAPEGTPVVMPYPALIIKDGWDSTGFGNHIRAQFFGAGNGTYGIFGHLVREIVSVGQRLEAGQVGGYVGTTGNSTGNHLHFEMRTSPYDPNTSFDYTAAWRGGTSVTPAVGKPGVDLPWWADKPIELLRSVVNTGVDMISMPGLFGDMLRGIPNKLFDEFKGYLGGLLGSGQPMGEDDIQGGKYVWNGREVPHNGTQMFDNGGLLQPGVTQVLNMTGKPEPVFTADDYLRPGGGGRAPLVGHLDVDVNGSDVTAGDVADEIMWRVRRIEHGGKYATAGI